MGAREVPVKCHGIMNRYGWPQNQMKRTLITLGHWENASSLLVARGRRSNFGRSCGRICWLAKRDNLDMPQVSIRRPLP